MSYIGEKKVKSQAVTDETTPGGVKIVEVKFADNTVENFSELMLEKIVSDKACDLTQLRDKRVFPVVEIVLGIMRDWGIKLSELAYLSGVLNRSLDNNTNEALLELWSQYMPKPAAPDEVDLISIDKVLKAKKVKLEDVLK